MGQNRLKTDFSKMDRGPFGVHKQLKQAHFEPVWSPIGPSKVPKHLEDEPFCRPIFAPKTVPLRGLLFLQKKTQQRSSDRSCYLDQR